MVEPPRHGKQFMDAEQISNEIEGLNDYLLLAKELAPPERELRAVRRRLDALTARLIDRARPFFISAVQKRYGSGMWAWPDEATRKGVELGLLHDAVLSWRERSAEENAKRTDALSTHINYYVTRHYRERRDEERNRLGLTDAPAKVNQNPLSFSDEKAARLPARSIELSPDAETLLKKLPEHPYPYRSLIRFLLEQGYDFETPRKTPGLLAEFGKQYGKAERTVRLWKEAALALLPVEKVRALLGMQPGETWSAETSSTSHATASAETLDSRSDMGESGQRSAGPVGCLAVPGWNSRNNFDAPPDGIALRAPKIRGFDQNWGWQPERYARTPGHVYTAEQRRAYEEWTAEHPGQAMPALVPWSVAAFVPGPGAYRRN